MSELLGRFSSLSLVGKGLVLLGVVAVIVPLAVIFRGSVALFVVLGGLVLVVVMLAALQGVLSARRRKNSSPFEQALAQAGAATPVGISEPARRARMDDLRKSFDSGLDKFKSAGKSLYSLPWYLVVGEPGSGKTEAIRHCNVGFPPGLQDELQGSGGTLNMNWWFTNHAVLLDTAGRLMFEEVPPGSTSEWNEFLKLLRRFRPNCPVNGMLLVIPAESLITDSAEMIQAKATRIARQFDTVQRTLGVRFPVFVVITKADLINGFREFFDTIKEPHLQHQMLGWSNSDDLDTAFDPDKVDEHLEEVCARLAKRRQALLLDPVHTDDPNARRTDQVDALFAFPESLSKLAPRLRQYLSHIFLQGEWSAKPLFLRGIYFTSSMREGSALDADLAEALGLPVGQLPEGRVWERDRAFFLRDLFMNKVFRERGLVTRVLNTARLRRTRAVAVLGTAAVGVVLLAGLTWFGAKTLSTAILEPLTFWSSTSRAFSAVQVPVDPRLGTDRHLLPIVQKQLAGEDFFRYRGFEADAGDLTTIEGVEPSMQRRAAFPKALREAAEREIAVPVVFKPVSLLAGDRGSSLLSTERENAARALIRASVVVPLLDSARMRIRSGSDAFESDPVWSAEATEALKELVRLYAVSGDAPAQRFGERSPRPGPLVRYATLGSADVEQGSVREDVALLESAVAWLFEHEEPAVVNASLRRSADVDLIESGVRAFAESARSGLTAGGGVSAGAEPASAETMVVRSGEPASRVLGQLQTLAETISRMEALSRSADPSVVREQWTELHKRATAASQGAAELAPSLGGSLSRALIEERRRAASGFEQSAAELQTLLAEAALNGGAAGSAVTLKFIEIKSELERDMGSLRRLAEDSAAAAIPEAVGALEQRFMAGSPASLELVRTLLARADERVRASLEAETLPSDPAMARERQRELSELSARVGQARSAFAERAGGEPLVNAVQAMVDRLDAADRRALAGATLADAPGSVTAVANAVAERAAGGTSGAGVAAFPSMPMAVDAGRGAAGAKFDARYHPASAAAVLRPILELRGVRVDEGEAAQKRAMALEAAGEYVRAYAAYWSAGVIEQALPAAETGWAEVHAAASGAPDAWMHHTPLRALVQASRQSGKALSEGLKGLMDSESVRELDRLERAAERALTTLDDAGFERAAQSRLGAWRGLGADAAGAAGSIRRALGEPARASEWFVTVPGRAGEADLAQAYWRGLCLRAAETLRRSASVESAAGLDLLRELAFPLAAEGASGGRAVALSPEDVAGLVARLGAAVRAGAERAGEASAQGRSFSPDAEIESHASALADGSGLSVMERTRLGEALAMAEWIVAQSGKADGVAYTARATAPMEGSVVVESGVVRVVAKDKSGGMVADRSFGGSGVWPALRMLARAAEVDASRGPGAWVATVELTAGDGSAARVAVEMVFGSATGGPPVLPFRRVSGR